MADTVFLSAVSSEFHKKDSQNPQSFQSYRDVLMLSLRHLIKGCQVIVQEELRQGFGDLLNTIDEEVERSSLVIHLVGDMAGASPTAAEIRRLRERHPEMLKHEPELAETLREIHKISYTQWEAYLAFEHRRGRLVFVADATAPRSPLFAPTDEQRASQKAHLDRLQITGEHREHCSNQAHLAQKTVIAILIHDLIQASKSRPALEKIIAAQAEASELAREIGATLRAVSKTAISEYDPAGIAAYLQALDAATDKRELDRRATLEILEENRAEIVAAVESDPTPENLYELAFAEMALGNYLEAIANIRPFVDRALDQMGTDPDRKDQHREQALNGYFLWHELCSLAGQRGEAMRVLEVGGSLIDAAKEPVLWADYHETLADYYLDHAQWDKAEALVDPIIDIREEQSEASPDLPKSLLLWCKSLCGGAHYSGVVSVAARAEKLFEQQIPPNLPAIARAVGFRAIGLDKMGRLGEAEPLMRKALAIDEQSFGPEDPSVATDLNNLAHLLRATNRLGEAESLARRALVIDEQNFGPEHPNVAICLNNLAQLLHATDRLGEAEPLRWRALTIYEQNFGPEHSNVAICLNNLAQLLHATDRLGEAEPLMQRALAILAASFGVEHPSTLSVCNNYAILLNALGRSEAEIDASVRQVLEGTPGPQ